jgi:hypothetical protein
MTAKEKAEAIQLSYMYKINDARIAKRCALIAVDEVMSVLTVVPYGITYLSLVEYWQEVKEEIEKL